MAKINLDATVLANKLEELIVAQSQNIQKIASTSNSLNEISERMKFIYKMIAIEFYKFTEANRQPHDFLTDYHMTDEEFVQFCRERDIMTKNLEGPDHEEF